MAGIHLGVGRNKTDEKVFADSGFIQHKIEGDFVKKGDVIMEVFGKDEQCFDSAMPILSDSITYSEKEIARKDLILKEIL